jgi:flagellar hook-associated protein 3
MSFRVTPHRQYELGQYQAQNRYAQSARLQNQISSGVKISSPSDDPAGLKVVLSQQSLLQRYTTQLDSLDRAKTVLTDAQTQIQDAQQIFVTAKNLALQARQSTDESERSVIVRQLDGLLTQLQSIANSQSGGEYLFSGTLTGTMPFPTNEAAAGYQGSSQAGEINLPGVGTISTFYSGQDVFQPGTSGNIVVTGKTGVASGTGTSSGSAPTTLIVRHTSTTYAGGSGLQPGASSADGDTIIGAAGTHKITLVDTSGTGTSGTVSLDGGSSIPFTSADGDLKITGPDGQVVFINTQSITPGFNGTVDITADGTLSIDGGTTETPIDFSSDQVLTNDSLGVVQHFDTSAAVRTGTVTVEPGNNTDLFQTIKSLRDTIANTSALSSADLNAAFDRRMQELDAASNHLLDIIGQQSVSLEQIDKVQSRIQTLQLNSQTTLNDAQSTDYTEAAVQLQEQQNLMQYTLQTLSLLNNISLIDFLR